MASADEEQVDLVPEWLAKGHSLHFPGPQASAAGTRDSRQGRGSSSSSRGLMTPDSPFLQQQQQQHQRGVALHGVSSLLTTSRSEEQPAGWSPKPLQHRSTGFAGNHQRSSHNGNGATKVSSYEERHHTLSSPFNPTGKGSTSSSEFWPHKGSTSTSTVSSSSTCNTADRGNSSATIHSQRQRFGLQRTLSEGSGRHADAQGVDDVHHKESVHHSSRGQRAPGAAARKLELNPSEFPSLGASSSSGNSPHHSSNSSKQASPEPYTPSLAPYKQGFLASRGSAGWTSKLADVPAAAATDGTQPDAEARSYAEGRAAGAANAHCSSRGGAADEQGGDATGAHAMRKSGNAVAAASNTGASPVACGTSSSSNTAGAPAVQLQPSLADTLRQAAAAAAGSASSAGQPSDAQRRHSKSLVPLLPGCKGKHAGTATRTAPAPVGMRLSAASGNRAAVADLQSPTGHAPLLMLSHSSHSSNHLSQGSQSSSNTTVGSLHHTAVDQGTAVPAEAGVRTGTKTPPLQWPVAVAAAAGGGAGATAQGPHPTSTAVIQASRLAGGSGSAGSAEQRQQLRDRNSFFAVLRRKTSSASSTGKTGGSDGGLASSKGSSSTCSTGETGGSDVGPASSRGSSSTGELCGNGGGLAVRDGSGSSCHGEKGGSDSGITSKDESGSSSSNVGAAGEVHPVCNHTVAAVEPDEKGTSSCTAAPTAPAAAASAAVVADVDGARRVSGAEVNPNSQQQQQQQCEAASSRVQADVHASKQASVVTAVEQQQQQQHDQLLPENTVSSHPISSSSSQCEEHFELVSTQQEHDRENAELRLIPGSPQKEHSSSSASLLWDLPAEEEAFLRSLGWTAESSDDESDWGLTEEEIAAFQAEAAARAASQQARRQQQQQQQQQQEGLLMANGYASISLLQLQQKAQQLQCYDSSRGSNSGSTCFSYGGSAVRGVCVWGVGMSSSRHVRGSGWGRQAGLLLGTNMLPAAVLLGYDGYNDSSSSSDEDDA